MQEESGKKQAPEHTAQGREPRDSCVHLAPPGRHLEKIHQSPFLLGTDHLSEILVTRETLHAGRHHLQAGTDLSSRSRFCFRAWRSITLVLVLVFFQE